jgi:hypothetical protein
MKKEINSKACIKYREREIPDNEIRFKTVIEKFEK